MAKKDADEREARLAAALRANLKRRKAQNRARIDAGSTEQGEDVSSNDAQAAPKPSDIAAKDATR